MSRKLPRLEDLEPLPLSIGMYEMGGKGGPPLWERVLAWLRRKPLDHDGWDDRL